MKRWKRICLILLALTLCVSTLLTPAALAADGTEEDGAVPYATSYITDYSASLTVDANGIHAIAMVEGVSSVIKCQLTVTVQQRKGLITWADLATYTSTSNSSCLEMVKKPVLAAGSTYRIKVVATVWTSSTSQSKTFYSDELMLYAVLSDEDVDVA